MNKCVTNIYKKNSVAWSASKLCRPSDRLLLAKYIYICLSQWPCGLRHEMSSPAWALGSWVRIPLEAWMFVCVYSVFVLSSVGSGLADHSSKESYQPSRSVRLWNLIRGGLGPTWAGAPYKKKKNIYITGYDLWLSVCVCYAWIWITGLNYTHNQKMVAVRGTYSSDRIAS
jgi:hypothetical protein